MKHQFDVIIVGAGLAGLRAAIELAMRGKAFGDAGAKVVVEDFLVGEEDAITPPHIVKLAHEEVPGSEFDTIAGAGHSAYFEKAADWNERVFRFLAESNWEG